MSDSVAPSGQDLALGAPGEAPALRQDRALLALLLFALALQLASWSFQRGYPEADAVEYVERAQVWVNSTGLAEGTTLRPFAYSLLFTPLFAVARWIGIEDLRPLFALARCVQMALALALLVAVVRLATQLAGRRAGLAAGFLLAVNPIVLEYSVVPVSGIAAALCLARALHAVLDGGGGRRGLRAGLWAGAAVMFAYTSLLPAMLVLLGMLARDRWRGRETWLAFCAGLAIALLAQVALDRAVYGGWGESILPYVTVNLGGIVSRWLWNLDFKEAASRVYAHVQASQGANYTPVDYSYEARQLVETWWYASHLPQLLVWPVLAFGALALARCVDHPRWKTTLLAATLIGSAFVMSYKGWKSFRLWLPLLPFALPLCALGFELAYARAVRWGGPARAVVLLVLAAALPLGVRALPKYRFAQYSGYWEAMAGVERLVEAQPPGDRPPRLAAGFDWAVYLRASPRIETVRLYELLDRTPVSGDGTRAEQMRALDDLDWLVVHLPVLTMRPDLMEEVNKRFEIRGAWYDPGRHGDLGPVLALARRTGAGVRFYEVLRKEPPPSNESLRELRAPLYFAGRGEDGSDERLALLDVERSVLPGSGWSWITYTWRAQTRLTRNYRALARVTGPAGVHLWQNPHDIAYGALPLTRWEPGAIVREGFIVLPRELTEQQRREVLSAPLEERERRDAPLWISLVSDRSIERPMPRLELVRENDPRPVRESLGPDALESADGIRFTRDGLVLVGWVGLPLDAAPSSPP